ncbi:MAG TPA: SDR family NAD(P)-dependent oxidoreductase [Spirochaetia bacterium]|nr:SDR family NAD(P)-dependent oxidoreductase [Spirochaetia bacterium]
MPGSDALRSRYGPWALIAGASEGIGAAFAAELGGNGLNLLLVARRPGPLEETASRIRDASGVQVITAAADLGSAAGIADVSRAARDREIGLLVCNAASSYEGPFFKAPLAKYRDVIEVNCQAPLALIDMTAPAMAERRRGGIILMSSMAAFQGSPYVAVYSATKAFLLSLAEGLSVEMKPRGIDVLACCPAVVRTPNYLASRPAGAKGTPVDVEPDLVAKEALRALGRRAVLVPGAKVRMAHFAMTRLMPRSAAVAMMASSTRAMYGD